MLERYGVALFDDPHLYQSGHACVGGEEGRPFQFRTPGELPTDVIWLTNVEGETYLRSGLSKTPRFRQDYYLRTKLSSIALELGLRSLTRADQVVRLAELFSSTMQLTRWHLGLFGAPAGTLAGGLRELVFPELEPVDQYVRVAAEEATQTYVQCLRPAGESDDGEDRLISLVLPRFTHAAQICAYPIPFGEWALAPRDLLKQPQHILLDELTRENRERPALVKVRVHHVDEHVHALLNYGAGAGLQGRMTQGGSAWTARNEREWLTDVELRMLREFAEIEIKEILIGEGLRPNPISLPQWGSAGQMSYGAGLLVENLWVSLGRDFSGRVARAPLTAWMHSIDRSICFDAALKLKSEPGVIVHSYGYGRVTIRVREPSYRHLAELAIRIRALPPMSSVPEAFKRPLSASPSTEELLRAIYERGEWEAIVALDRRAHEFAKNNAPVHSSPEDDPSAKNEAQRRRETAASTRISLG